MDTEKILAELRGERDRISQAINALEALNGAVAIRRKPGRPKAATTVKPKRKKGLTDAGRKRLSEMMKKRWAERRRNGRRNLG
jgi:hypothetical protein